MIGSAPGVSVVVVTRDRVSLLKDAVRDLAFQEPAESVFEIIISDDSENEGTEALIRQLQQDPAYKMLRYVRPQTRGINVARNAGVVSARGEIISFVDDDVALPNNWLRELLSGISADPTAGCWAGRIIDRNEGSIPRMCEDCRPTPLATTLDLGRGTRDAQFAWGANMAFPKAIFEEVGPFNEFMQVGGDEVEWQVRVKRRGYRISYLHEAFVIHRRTQQSLRVRSLIKSYYYRDRNNAIYHLLTDTPSQTVAHLIPRSLGHAVRKRCWYGVMMAAAELGSTWGRIRYRRSSAKHRLP